MSDNRLFDQSSYSSRTISTFRIVGAYFVNIYYNHLYQEAIKFKNEGKIGSITEGYKHATFAFLSALDNKSKATYKADSYNKLLIGINDYFMVWTSFTSITLGECLDKIVQEFVPTDYYSSLDKDQKRNILRTILINVIREFTKIVITEWLSAIIDNHEEMANIDALKERIVELFIVEREKMFHLFLDSHGSKQSEKVDKKYADKMRNEILKLNEEKTKLIDIVKTTRQELEVRTEQLTKVLAKYRKMEHSYKQIVAEYQISKEKIQSLEIAAEETAEELSVLQASHLTQIPQPTSSMFDNQETEDTEDTDTMNELLNKHIITDGTNISSLDKPSNLMINTQLIELQEPNIVVPKKEEIKKKQFIKPVAKTPLKQPTSKVEPTKLIEKQPTKPTTKVEPTKLIEKQPTKLTTKVEPTKPIEKQPTKPTTKVEPTKPIEKQPTKPTTKVEPTKPTTKVEPTKPIEKQPTKSTNLQQVVNKNREELDESDEEESDEEESDEDIKPAKQQTDIENTKTINKDIEKSDGDVESEEESNKPDNTMPIPSPISFGKKIQNTEKNYLGEEPKLSDIY